jgi:hypothetical protein
MVILCPQLATLPGGRLMSAHPRPLAISDSQLSWLMNFVEPLEPTDRSAFLFALAALLHQEPQPIGDGALFRTARDLRKEFWRPPLVTSELDVSRPSKLKRQPAIG